MENPSSRPLTPLSTSIPSSDHRSGNAPIPHLNMPHDFDDLLEGLGSDDLDDFELDGDALGEEEPSSNENNLSSDTFFHPSSMAAGGGFKTAKGTALPPPSASALNRARRMMEETEEYMPQDAPSKRRRIEALSSSPAPLGEPAYVSAHLTRLAAYRHPDASPGPPQSGFSTGSMKPVAPLSEESRKRAFALFGEDVNQAGLSQKSTGSVDGLSTLREGTTPLGSKAVSMPISQEEEEMFGEDYDDFPLPGDESKHMLNSREPFDEFDDNSFQTTSIPVGGGFTSGKGRPLPPPSRASLQKVAQLFQDEDNDDDDKGNIHASLPATPATGFITGLGRAVAPPSTASRGAVANLFGEPSSKAPASGFQLASGSPAPTSTASRDKALALFGETPSRPKAPSSRDVALSILGEADAKSSPRPSRPSFAQPATPQFRSPMPVGFRTPLRPTTNTFSTPNTTKAGLVKVRPIEIKTPTVKHLGTGRTPVTGRKTGTKFVTPFKTPQMKAPGPTNIIAPVRAPTPIQDMPVFDLNIPPDRKSMREAHIKPQYHDISELIEMGLPDEIWNLDLSNAKYYQFIADDASVLNVEAALRVLAREGCRLATLPWVENHWGMILWKNAGLIRTQPEIFDQKWNWGEMIEQLKYRYEREFGAAQRPIVRRIQEQDTSSSVSMVLCVSAIHRPEPATDEEGKVVPVKPFLELTDGWYRINAEIDDCLVRAVNKGVIDIGRKIAISGARLESSGEGEDVLKALNKSRIVISGNSTSPALWDARLGAHEPFIASLFSLSPDGGMISLMAVTVERVFPLAFCHVDKSSTIEQPWNEEEDAVRADKWKETYESESAKVREETRASLATIEEVASLLISNAEEAECTQDTPPDNLDAEFDRLLLAKNPSAAIRGMSDTKIVHLARYAQSRMEAEMGDAESEVQAQLQTLCPPRQIRDFRIVRLIDAIKGDRGHVRTALLTIWDAAGLDLVEGKSYLVSNLMPGRQGDWALPKGGGATREIYLNSRRDTRWLSFEPQETE